MIEYIALGIIIVVMVGALYLGPKRSSVQHHESDIRLPYKKYRELYPKTDFTYDEYKKMQAKEAFKTAIPSKMLKRMVR
jgi:hypothetical protein